MTFFIVLSLAGWIESAEYPNVPFIVGALAFLAGGFWHVGKPKAFLPWIPFIGGGVIIVIKLISIC